MLAGLRRLGQEDPRVIAEALVLLGHVRLRLHFSSFQALQRCLLRSGPERHVPVPVPRLAWIVRNAAKLVPGASCLTQALAFQAMLHRRGILSELSLGVRHNDRGEFAAHAWVSVDGVVQLGGTAQQLAAFAPIAEFGVESI